MVSDFWMHWSEVTHTVNYLYQNPISVAKMKWWSCKSFDFTCHLFSFNFLITIDGYLEFLFSTLKADVVRCKKVSIGGTYHKKVFALDVAWTLIRLEMTGDEKFREIQLPIAILRFLMMYYTGCCAFCTLSRPIILIQIALSLAIQDV